MKSSFISLATSSNDLTRAKMLHVAVLVTEEGEMISEFESYIKAVPRLSKTEKMALRFDYSKITSAPLLSDIAPLIIEILENTNTVFFDGFSESIFKKSFRNIGYSVGSATYILEKKIKKTLKVTDPINLDNALDILKLEQSVDSNMGKCLAMEKIFSKLQHSLNSGNFNVPYIAETKNQDQKQIDFSLLPNTPGVYFFRDINNKSIYVGKAKQIAKRVRSHFTSKLKSELELCRETFFVDFEETGSEIIALLLEAHYISSLQPFYNTLQKEILDPFIISSKIDSKGILRIQLLQKSYTDSENEFYYNRTSVLQKVMQVQQKFNLCRRYAGIERTSSRCSDPIFCKGICEGLETIETYNKRVQEALDYIFAQRPSYIIRLQGRSPFEQGFVLVKHGIYHGFGFIDMDSNINSLDDIEGFIKYYPHNYFTSRILDQYFKNNRNTSQNLISLS